MQDQTVAFDLELPDHKALIAHVCAPAKPGRKRLAQFTVMIGIVAVAVGASRVVESTDRFLLGMIAMPLLLFVGIKILLSGRAQVDPIPGGSILCHYTISLKEHGLDIRTPLWESVARWEGIISVVETATHVFLMIDRAAGYTIPKRAFADELSLRAFVEAAQIHSRRVASPSTS